MKSIGLDVHSSSITATVMDKKGKIIDNCTLGVSEKLITDYISSIKGKKQLVLEEGTMAQWMANILQNKVDKLVVCDPRRNALIYKGKSNDDIDSRDLAELLRLDALKSINHPLSTDRQEFRELINQWVKIQRDKTRAKLRLKAKFRMNGIQCTGSKIYNQKKKDIWVKKLPNKNITPVCVQMFWDQISLFESHEEVLYEKIKVMAKKFSEIKEFLKERGVGLITAATFSASIFTPWRFKKKSQLVTYCGFGLIVNDTGKKLNKNDEKRRQKKVLKRLNKECNRNLKSKLKSAAQCAVHQCNDGPLKEKYLKLRSRGLDGNSAMLTVSRELTIKLWGIWKRIERETNKK